MFRITWVGLLLGITVLCACEGDAKCPPGRQKVGSQCRPVADSDPVLANDAGVDGTGDAAVCAKELCNGLDDDCDSKIDEGLEATVYIDADLDGSGAGAKVNGCARSGFSTTNDDCDDQDPARAGVLSELCDGVDNDCDSQIDQSFACTAGTLDIACTTSCGSQGKGACTDQCTIPTATACVPPAEICNGADDNCDGMTDEGLLKRVAPDGVWTYPNRTMTGYLSTLSMTPRSTSGAWLFYLPSPEQGSETTPRAISAYSLLSDGSVGSVMSAASSKMANTTDFVASGNYKVTAVVSRTYGLVASGLRVQVFDASTLAFVAETLAVLTSPGGAPATSSDVMPIDVAVHSTEDGHHYVAIVYDLIANGGGRKVMVNHLRPTGVWDPPTISSTALTGYDYARVQIETVPCRPQFILADTEATQMRLMHVDLNATTRSSLLIPGASWGLTAMAPMPSACASDGPPPELLVAYRKNDVEWGQTHFMRVQLTEAGDYINAGDVDSKTKIIAGEAVYSGGRWFVTGYEYQQLNFGLAAPWMWEVRFDGKENERVREVPLLAPGTGVALPGKLGSVGIEMFRTALRYTGGALVAAFPHSSDPDSGSLLPGARPAGVTDPVVAGTYRLGCP